MTANVNDIVAARLELMSKLFKGVNDTESTIVVWSLNGREEEHRQVALVGRILNALSGKGEEYEAQLRELAEYAENRFTKKESQTPTEFAVTSHTGRQRKLRPRKKV